MTSGEVHVLLTGGTGQLGRELLRASWPANLVLDAPGRDELDMQIASSITAAVGRRPYAAVINSAAFTAVDQAESEVGGAFAINAQGVAVLADATREACIPLIHISTDYVFNGHLDRPYEETDAVAPANVYGASKLAGELAALAGNPRALVLRTAWLVSPFGKNFLKTVLRLSASREAISIVDDQIGNPTSAADLAAVIINVTRRLIDDPNLAGGVFHFANSGDASWREFAETIVAISGSSCQVLPITTTEFQTRARRPSNSRLNTAKLQATFGITPRPWQNFVPEIITEIESGTHDQ